MLTDMLALVVAVFCFLALLGALREIVILRGEVAALINLVTLPTEQSVGGALPDSLIAHINRVIRGDEPPVAPHRLLVAFVSASCLS